VVPVTSMQHGNRTLRITLVAGIFVLLVLKFHLLTVVNVNWDEFRFLSRIHELQRGELATAFQTFHVRLFAWLPGVAVNEVDQVIAGRMVAFALRVGSCVLIFLIGRRLYGSTGALFAVLASLGFSHLMRHGEAFRADPIIAFLFLAAAAQLLLRPSSSWFTMGAAAALGLSVLVSIKGVFYLPAIAVILLAPWVAGTGGRPEVRRLVTFAVVAPATFAVLHLLHAGALSGDGTGVAAAALSQAGEVSTRVLWTTPFIEALVESLQFDRAFWPLLVIGAALAATEGLRGAAQARATAVVTLGMLVPVLSLLFYRNTFAYYYAVIIPPASLACGLVAARLEAWLARRPVLGAATVLLLAVPLGEPGVKAWSLLRDDTIAGQRQLLAAVREIFPVPVTYIDRCSMVAAYPKAGPFMTTYVLSTYRELGEAIMPGLVRDRRPVFVLANVSGLELGAEWGAIGQLQHRLLREDFEFLRARYVHHWGPVFVAGASLETVTGEDRAFELPVDGVYTLESSGAVSVDGRPRSAGEAFRLAAGPHLARSLNEPGRLTVRYGDHLPRPSGPPPSAPQFLDLGLRSLAAPTSR
jgi:hypothetical protein